MAAAIDGNGKLSKKKPFQVDTTYIVLQEWQNLQHHQQVRDKSKIMVYKVQEKR